MDSTGNPGIGGSSSLRVGRPVVIVTVSVIGIVVETFSVEVNELIVVWSIIEVSVARGIVVTDV